MFRNLWVVCVVAAGCKGADGMPIGGPDGSMTTSCDTNMQCKAGEYCAASKKCEPAIELRGFTARVESFQCSPPGQTMRQCGAYRTSFVVHNHHATDAVLRLEHMTLTGGGGFNISSSMHCTFTPWTIPAASMTGIIDVVFDYRGGPNDGGWPAWAVPCNNGILSPELIDDIGPGPTSGEISLTAQVRLGSGTTVDARAAATLTPL